jgi:hypothetical protein
MAAITLTANTQSQIPGNPGRKALAIYVESGGPVAWGWGTLDAGASRGIPLPAGQPMIFSDEESKAYSEPLSLFSAAASTVIYVEKF